MSWNMAPEVISTVILCIVWIYSRKGNPTPSLKNRLFQICFLTTFCSMVSNILSTTLIFFLNPYNLLLTWIITMIYFIMTPLMGMIYFFYALANIYEGHPKVNRYILIGSLPGAAYITAILLNPITRNVFDITLAEGYHQEKYISSTYIVFYLYCILSVLVALLKGKRVLMSIRIILFSFPSVAAVVIIIQMMMPSIVLTGSAATCAMLLIYLYLQNKQISIDYLTGIPNRHEFLKMLEWNRKKNSSFSILVLSIREFKHINDTYGQNNGDALLASVSNYLRKELGLGEGEIYRYSGDEFAILLLNTENDRTRTIAEKLVNRMMQPWKTKSCTCILSAALGIVNYPETTDQVEGLINGLEYAVTAAKHDPESKYVCYCTQELLEKANRRQIIGDLLLQYLNEDKFEVYYQPIWSVGTERFVCAEALLRMNHTPLGSISPAEFIPIAEESGLIIEITYLVLEKVSRVIRELLDQGIDLDWISVNFSTLQFKQKDLVPRMLNILQRNKAPETAVKIEITESTLAENMELIKTFIRQMHEIGVRIGLDDFGTGYSNFTSVIDLSIDTVKLDKSLVWTARKNLRLAKAVQNFIRAFQELEMTVLAEGVEDEEQRDLVIAWSCHYIQGFLYARPMPEEAFKTFILEDYLKVK